MFVCGDCGEVFAEPRRITEAHGQDTPPFEAYDVCPACGDTAILDAIYCDSCGAVITGRYIELEHNGHKHCGDCYMVRAYND